MKLAGPIQTLPTTTSSELECASSLTPQIAQADSKPEHVMVISDSEGMLEDGVINRIAGSEGDQHQFKNSHYPVFDFPCQELRDSGTNTFD